jgi:hypothetical protein
MQPLTDEILRNSGVLLASLQMYAATHAPGYRRTVDTVLQAEENQEALLRGHDAPEPAPHRRRGHVKHRLILAWDSALAGSESMLQRASRMVQGASKLLFRWSDYIGDRRPRCVFECTICDQRNHETNCLFTGDQVLCVECVRDVVICCNTGRQADEPTFTCQMLVQLLTLDTTPYWRQTEDAQHWLSMEAEVRAVRWADIGAVDEPVRTRWGLALNRFVGRLEYAQVSCSDPGKAEDAWISALLEEALNDR